MNELQITEYKDIRVLTTQQIAEAYGTDSKQILRNFQRNSEKYSEGKHYICLSGEELRKFKGSRQNDDTLKFTSNLYLWTQGGALMLAKSLNTDEAWEVYEHLVDFYFNRKKTMTLPEQIQVVAQGYVELEQKVDGINKDLQDFKQDLPLLAVECEKITRAVRIKGTDVLGGKNSEAYNDKSIRGKVYQDIHNEIKRQFGVNTYKAIKRNQCELVVQIINNYQLPMSLEEQVRESNVQIRM